jgi:dTDP-glucose 4,6-dehydratase
MPKALVTGGCGFIASNFLNTMKEIHPEIDFFNIDKLDYCSNVHNVRDGVATLIHANLCDVGIVESLIKEHKFEYVFHFAAQSHVDNSFSNPLDFTRENTLGTHILVEMCRRHVPHAEFIHFSTDEVYGESKENEVPFTETAGVLRPTNPYSASKAAAEMIIMSYIESFNMNIKIIRCNNVYGPNQYPEKLIPKFIRMLKQNKKCTIHGLNSAKVRRAFIHVDDVVDAVFTVWQKGIPGEVYNVASDNEMSVLDVTKLIIKIIKDTDDYDQWVEYVEDRPFNDQRYHICAEKLKSLGWVQKKKGRDALVEFIYDKQGSSYL